MWLCRLSWIDSKLLDEPPSRLWLLNWGQSWIVISSLYTAAVVCLKLFVNSLFGLPINKQVIYTKENGYLLLEVPYV